MKVGALVLGIIGGLVALFYGLVGYGLGSLADVGQSGAGAVLKILSLGLPIAALVGAGVVLAKPIIGAALMAIAALVLVLILGFNFFSLIPVVLLGLAAVLGFLGSQDDAKKYLALSTQPQFAKVSPPVVTLRTASESFCPNCSKKNPVTSSFCGHCGTRL
jgi:zinc-ribbon domain